MPVDKGHRSGWEGKATGALRDDQGDERGEKEGVEHVECPCGEVCLCGIIDAEALVFGLFQVVVVTGRDSL